MVELPKTMTSCNMILKVLLVMRALGMTAQSA